MTLEKGTKLGPYQIEEAIGAGGMGEVYRASDTRLGRTVAIKVLPSHLSERPDVKQRFEREARTISNLSHPYICALYDIGHDNGTDYLVMEYLEGETLADRLSKKKLAPDETLRIASEMTQALDKAHRSGVVHRDLKPGNIMLTRSGVKLLDFGLAKIAESDSNPVGSALTEVATEQRSDKPLTAEGTILGTFQYMAPEQLEGKEADTRTDIFAFGAVLYEMATGKKAFEGGSQASLIASILRETPEPISQIEPLTPLSLDRLTKACLEKDPEDRIQTAHDVNLHLTWINEGGTDVGLPVSPSTKRKRRERVWMAAALAMATAVVALASSIILGRQSQRTEIITLSLARPAQADYVLSSYPALSPDGSTIAFVGITADDRLSLWVQTMGTAEVTQLPATDGAEHPFWSPDSRHIGFFAGGKLKRINASGGPPQIICDATAAEGAAWGSEDIIVFSSRARGQRGRATNQVPQSLKSVPAGGGTPALVTELDQSEQAHIWPSFLPDGRHFIFLGDAPTAEAHHLRLGSLDSKEAKNLAGAISNFQFVPPNTILFCRSGTLLAQKLNVSDKELIGEPVPLATELVIRPGHFYEFTASHNGILAYRSASPMSQLTWFDRSGKRLETIGNKRRLGWPVHLSPDETRVAFETLDSEGRDEDVWITDLARDMASRLTQEGTDDGSFVWSPDGSRIAFNSSRLGATGNWRFFTKSTDGVGEAVLFSDSLAGEVYDWSPDGEVLAAYVEDRPPTDLWAIPLNGDRPFPLADTKLGILDAKFSPDGRWVAYEGEASGQPDIYLQSFPVPSTRLRVAAGGWTPCWRGDGRELYYIGPDEDEIMVVEVQTGDNVSVGTPRVLFEIPEGIQAFDVTEDGERFIVVVNVVNRFAEPMTVILNWEENLKKASK